MPATYTAYPTPAEVLTLISAAGYTVPSGFVEAEIDPYVYGAIREWEEGTQYRPFLADADSDEAFYYDPPGPNRFGWTRGGRWTLILDRGFAAVGEVRTGITPDDDDGTLLVEGDDYRLMPHNAVYDGVPFTMIEFVTRKYGAAKSIKVVGRPGYAVNIPADAWNAIRKLAAARALEAIREGQMGGIVEWKEGDASERSSIENIAKVGDSYMTAAMNAMLRYRRMS